MWQPFTLSATVEGEPIVRTVRTWEALKKHLYPHFVLKDENTFDPDIQDQGSKVFERLENTGRRPRARRGKGRHFIDEDETHAEAAGGEASDAKERGSEGRTESQRSTGQPWDFNMILNPAAP